MGNIHVHAHSHNPTWSSHTPINFSITSTTIYILSTNLTHIHTDDNTHELIQSQHMHGCTLHNHNVSMFLYGRVVLPPTSGWLKHRAWCPFYAPSRPGRCVQHASIKKCCKHYLFRVRDVAGNWRICGATTWVWDRWAEWERPQGKGNIGMIRGTGSMGTWGCKRRGHVLKSTGVKGHRMIETDCRTE